VPPGAIDASAPSLTARWLALPAPVHTDADPSGTRLSVTALHVPLGTEQERPALFVVDLATGEATVAPGLPEGAHTATWSPDGTWLALTIEHEGRSQLAVTDVASTDNPTRVVTSLPVGVEGPASWSPDGRRLVVAGRRGRVTDPSRPWRTSSAVPWVDGIGRLDDPPQLWICDVESGACSMLTDDEWHWSLPRWSPDGSTIAACASFDPDGTPPPQHLRVVSLDGSWSAPEVPGGLAVVPAWLGDGGLVVLIIDPSDRPTGSTAQLHHVQPDGTIRRLDGDCPVEVGGQVYGDSAARLGDVPGGALLVRGDEIYVRTNEGGRMGVVRGSITTGEWRMVVTGDRCATPLAVGPYGLAIADQSAASPCRLAVVSLEDHPDATGRVVHLPLPDPVDVPATAEVRRFVVPSPHDGVALEGCVRRVLPDRRASALRRGVWSALHQPPRIHRFWRRLRTRRVRPLGRHPERRRARRGGPRRGVRLGRPGPARRDGSLLRRLPHGVARVHDRPLPRRREREPGDRPARHVRLQRRRALVHTDALRADRCHTPLLFVVGLDDHRCPPTQALSMHRTLRSLGRTSEVLILPDSDHAGSVYGPVPGRIAHDEAIVEWFDRWLRQG
jgi:dipeptidyl aminopeptidase/acylaminoacyl peptidase